MSDPTPTTEAAEAPTTTAPPEAVSAPDTAPSSGAETPSVEAFVNDDTLDLDSSGLPDATVKEIKKLRGDAKRWRETASGWEQATSNWSPEDVQTLREALVAGPDAPDVVGKWMLESARALLGDEFATLTGGTAPTDDDSDDDDGGMLTKEQVAKLVQEQMAEAEKARQSVTAREAQVQKIIAETEALGFGPSNPLHEALLSTARHRFDGDLAKAAELLSQGAQSPTTTQDAPAEAGHTPVPQEGQAPAGTRRVSDPKQAAAERLAKTLGDAHGFPSL